MKKTIAFFKQNYELQENIIRPNEYTQSKSNGDTYQVLHQRISNESTFLLHEQWLYLFAFSRKLFILLKIAWDDWLFYFKNSTPTSNGMKFVSMHRKRSSLYTRIFIFNFELHTFSLRSVLLKCRKKPQSWTHQLEMQVKEKCESEKEGNDDLLQMVRRDKI